MDKKQKENINILVLIVILVVGVFILNKLGVNIYNAKPVANGQWLESYTQARVASGITDQFISESYLEDYSSPEMQDKIKYIAEHSRDAEDATQQVLDYVYFNMQYQLNEPDGICFNSKASDILLRGTYNCDTGSRLVRTMLRGMGIATRPVSGCLGISDSCRMTLAISGIDLPQYKELTDADVAKGTLGRGGGLHAWGSVWLPGYGWRDVEATAGRFADSLLCAKYLVEYVPSSVNQECVSSNPMFIQQCKSY